MKRSSKSTQNNSQLMLTTQPGLHGTGWRSIFVVLIPLIVVLPFAVWWLIRDDSEINNNGSVATGSHSPDRPATNTDERTDTNALADSDSNLSSVSGSSVSGQVETTEAIPTTSVIPDTDTNEFGPPTLGPWSSVSTVGIDNVNFGMSVQQAQEAAGTLLIPIEPVSKCYRAIPQNVSEGIDPKGIVFLVHDGTIERVDINSGPITTRSGLGIGTSDGAIASKFGRSIQRVARPDGTVDLIFVPKDEDDSHFRVVFNIVDGIVQSYKSGRSAQVLANTGCETLRSPVAKP